MSGQHLYRLILAFGLAAPLLGCGARIQGGQARHETHGWQVTVRDPASGNFVVVQDNRELVATTQPSVSSSSAATVPRIGTADEGQLGGVSFDQVRRTLADKNAWPLGIIFLLVAAALVYLRHFIAAAFSLAIGISAILYPQLLGAAAAVALAVLLWVGWQYFRQIKAGLKVVEDKSKQPVPSDPIAAMREKVDRRVQDALGIK